jgi:alkylhydroperoxidase/carboxymuconolactone decarboxylase family protein YurZ
MSPPYPEFIQRLQRTDPELFAVAVARHDLVMRPGALEQKTKMLILLAVDAFAGSTGVRGIAAAAREVGASDAEVAEALRVASHVAGNRVLAAGAAAFPEG